MPGGGGLTWQVSDGSIPETVERFLRENVELEVYQPSRLKRRTMGRWRLAATLRGADRKGENGWAIETWPIAWSRTDRAPTLHEAIAAVVRRA